MVKPVKKFVIDFWKTGLHGEEIGIRQKEQYRSKSRHFTMDMDIIGKYIEDDKGIGFAAIREKVWKGEKSEELNGRLVLRLFTDEGRWLGSIEEVVIEELKNSIGSNDVIPVFATTIPNYDYVLWIEKVHRRHGFGEVYVFSYLSEKEEEPVSVFKIDENRLTIGSDWDVYYGPTKQKVAFIDSKKFNIGGKVEINIYDEDFAKNRIATKALVLFASTIKYHNDIKERIKKRIELIKKGEWSYKPDKGEAWLLRNPRKFLM